MVMADRGDLIRRYVDHLLNGPDPLAASRELLTPNFVFIGPGNRGGVRGPDAFAALQDGFRTALAELRFDLVDAIVDAAGDRAALTLRMCGTHQASFLGVAPARAQVDLTLIDVVRFHGDRIAEVTAYLDALDLRRQLAAGAS
jgi:predicted ester cyclase